MNKTHNRVDRVTYQGQGSKLERVSEQSEGNKWCENIDYMCINVFIQNGGNV